MLKGLIKKDLYNLASYKITLLVIILFCGIAVVGTEAINWGAIVICAIVGMIALSTFNYDELAKSNKYILTLPINRKEIVQEKYIFSIGSIVLGGLLGFLLTAIVANVINYVRPENMINIDYESLINTTLGGMWAIAFIQAIQIPSVYKWGAEKGRVQMFVLLFIIIIIATGAGFLIKQSNLSIDMEMVENLINRFGLILLIATMIIMYFVSYKISYRIYQNKEE